MQATFAIPLDDSLQVLFARLRVAGGPLAEIAVVPLSLA
jgi:hypothetical protein